MGARRRIIQLSTRLFHSCRRTPAQRNRAPNAVSVHSGHELTEAPCLGKVFFHVDFGFKWF